MEIECTEFVCPNLEIKLVYIDSFVYSIRKAEYFFISASCGSSFFFFSKKNFIVRTNLLDEVF